MEDVAGAVRDLIQAGKVGTSALEAAPSKFAALTPCNPSPPAERIFIWWTAIEENGVLSACEELGIGLVPYSPLGRGYLTGKVTAETTFAESDIRSRNPRFTEEAIKANWAVVEFRIRSAQCTAQRRLKLLAWLLAKSRGLCRYQAAATAPAGGESGAIDITLTETDLSQIRKNYDQYHSGRTPLLGSPDCRRKENEHHT